jgi:chromosome segregation ATPase
MSPGSQLSSLEQSVAEAELKIFAIKDELAGLTDALTNISLDAADRRAANALQGRGLGGALFGAKYRAAMRRSAAADNARLSADIARRKREIAVAKQELKSRERELRAHISRLKMEIRAAKADERRSKISSTSRPAPHSPQNFTKDAVKAELQKLKALHQGGHLTAQQYEAERIRLLTPFT